MHKEALHIPQGLTQNFNLHSSEATAVVLVCVLKTWNYETGWWVKEALHASCFPVTVCEPFHVSGKNKSSSSENLLKTLYLQDNGPLPQSVESVGILGIESHFHSLNLMAQLDGGPQLQLHALLHRRESQQQERLAVNVLSENKVRLEPRQCTLRPYICPSSLHPGAKGGPRS